MSELLNVSDVTVQYATQGRTRNAIDKLSLSIPSEGYTLGVVGESGSGKTTLGLSIMNLIKSPGKIKSGTVEFNGKNVLKMSENQLRRYRWRDVSMVFQSAMNILNPVKNVSDHIVEVISAHQRISKHDARERARSLLTEVGIPRERGNAYAHELSGGMRQRVVIAMALALSPKLLIADEPTSALDVVVQQQILALLKREITNKKLSLIFITHEITLLQNLVDYVAVMYAGEIVEYGTLEQVLLGPMHPYTQMLLSSLLTLDSKRGSYADGSFTTKDSFAIPEIGCRFATRCKYVFDRCRVERPLLTKKEGGRLAACHKYKS